MVEQKRIEVRVVPKLYPLFVKKKRLKIAVGGRGGGKSNTYAKGFIRYCSAGERLLCAREFQNSIGDSVHSLIKREIRDMGVDDVVASESDVKSHRGGEIFYRGLSRNPESIKSTDGVKRCWIEEAQTLSEDSIKLLMPTIREADSEIWMSANRRRSKDAFSQRFLAPYEKKLRQQGFYEDDEMLIIQVNYWDNPWFNKALDQQRVMDKRTMSSAEYDHVWRGEYSDEVDGAIIRPEWFDACVNAHERLGFKPIGQRVVSFDPADSGDARALAYRHGVVIHEVAENERDDVNDATDWALGFSGRVRADRFVWDSDGLGLSLRRQINDSLAMAKVELVPFHGGLGVDRPNQPYVPVEGSMEQSRTNKDAFFNKRSQGYMLLADRIYKTYRAVENGVYTDPEEMISFAPGIKALPTLRSELCSVSRKENSTGRYQLRTKAEMKSKGIGSPNAGDAVMMLFSGKAGRKANRGHRRPPPEWRS